MDSASGCAISPAGAALHYCRLLHTSSRVRAEKTVPAIYLISLSKPASVNKTCLAGEEGTPIGMVQVTVVLVVSCLPGLPNRQY